MLTALLLVLLCPARAADGDMRLVSLPHYAMRLQAARMPSSLDIELERIHSRLAFDLSLFSPWMLKERVNLYLYRDKAAYAESTFKPAPWSIGYSIYEDKVLLVYSQPDRKALLEVISHESTHLYFESYWAGLKGEQPPSWINEGFAMLEESDSRMHPELSDRYRAMLELPGRELPLDKFFGIAPTKDLAGADDKPDVTLWYTQAYSIAFFLIREHTGRQFKDFCDLVRGGTGVEDALKQTYKIASLEQFEHDWMRWLKRPIHRRRIEGFGAAPAAMRSLHSEAGGPPSVPSLKDGFSRRDR